MATKSIFDNFPLTDAEYLLLDEEFGDLCRFAAWQLKRKNVKNNCTEDFDDYVQDFREAMMTAGVYYKRQTYIQDSLALAEEHAPDEFTRAVVAELNRLWKDRKRHGANRQKFGDLQERILDRLVAQTVPAHLRPKKDRPLVLDQRFPKYCKNVIWNRQRSTGRKITRERAIRNGLVSLSNFDYLSCSSGGYQEVADDD
jgi:hypothetical protein